jgi:Flp pilus assembly protein TadG
MDSHSDTRRETRRPSSRSEAAQTLPLVVMFLFCLIGICGLSIDGGSWLQDKRAVQNSADASALAGADFLPISWANASGTAATYFARNQQTGASATYAQKSTYQPNDSIQVTVTRQAPTFFAQIFGIKHVTVTATATATLEQNGGGALPWAVMNNTYTPGTSYQIYTDNSGPNDGAVRLPALDTGSQTCTTGNVNGLGGSALYKAQITGGIVNTCAITLNQVISTDTGNNTGPTSQGINARCSSLQPPTTIASFSPVKILQPTSCQLVLLPVVINAQNGSNNWPQQGSGQVKVVSFSWWIIKDYANGGKIVDAVYVGPAPTDPTITNALPGAYTAALTG